MFTGIITSVGIIESTQRQGDLRIKIACDFKTESMRPGDSVAVSGVCLTVAAKGFLSSGKTYFTASVSQETLNCTVPSGWEKGRKVNLERALKIGDGLGGHLITGHIDGIAIIKNIEISGDSRIVSLEAPEALTRFIAEKGSVTLDGVSLTVNKVENQLFLVNIIPHTWQNTTLGERKPGDSLNLEVDLIARYAARLLSKS